MKRSRSPLQTVGSSRKKSSKPAGEMTSENRPSLAAPSNFQVMPSPAQTSELTSRRSFGASSASVVRSVRAALMAAIAVAALRSIG